ncbi:probable G-protein coupled receptor 83 [Haliotis rubra]|uniref:probable G-protein coupled receptor 83 n=1 Tax=Haliotis rubra TaxID=36100 RepID=UPI001EE5FCBF|nr:probable G-protein coupled receptor 83 [Haliotis rubra]
MVFHEAMAYDDVWHLLGLDDKNVTRTDISLWLSNQSNGSSFKSQSFKRDQTVENIIIVIAYSILSLISFFGNSLVCYVILKNKRLHTATNFFIANLAVSDLLITCINVPFNILRHILDEWPLGDFLCHLVNFSLMTSVYVSTYTLTAIAIDRHRVILTPLTIRMSKQLAITVLVFIWVLAICLSLPYGIYTSVQEVNLFTSKLRRCRSSFPDTLDSFEQYLTVVTIIMQYCIPLAFIAFAYGRIVRKLWARTHVGAVTENQHQSQQRAKRRSIKLLIAVVIVFALCWLPLILYHLLTDFHPNAEVFHHDSRAFFICHWIAISSTCYNPFVYCWLNENFREEVKARFRWCGYRAFKIYPGCSEVDGGLLRNDRGDRKRGRGLPSITRSSIACSSRSTSVKRDTSISPDEIENFCPFKLNGSPPRIDEKDTIKEETTELIPKCDISNGKVELHLK